MSTISRHACFNDISQNVGYIYLLFEIADIHVCLTCNTETIKPG